MPPRWVPVISPVLNCAFSIRGWLRRKPPIPALLADSHRDRPISLRECRSVLGLWYVYRKQKFTGDVRSSFNSMGKVIDLVRGIVSASGRGIWLKLGGEAMIRNFQDLQVSGVRKEKNVELFNPGNLSRSIELAMSDAGNSSFSSLWEAQQALAKDASGVSGKQEKLWFSKAGLAGVSDYWMLFFQDWRGGLGRPGECVVHVDGGSTAAILRECSVRSTREKVFHSYQRNRVGEGFHNRILVLLKERQKIASKLGFSSWGQLEDSGLPEFNNDRRAKYKVDEIWAALLPAVKCEVEKMEKSKKNIKPKKSKDFGPLTDIDVIDESFLRDLRVHSKLTLPANYDTVVKLLRIVGKVFDVQFNKEGGISWIKHGWGKETLVFRVTKLTGESLGFIYLNLWRSGKGSSLAGAGEIAKGHISIEMQFFKGQLLEQRRFEFEEMGALAHEVAHAIHFLLYPGNQYFMAPLDVNEFPSVLMEVLFYQKDTINALFPKLSTEDLINSSRNIFSYLRMLRSLAVYEAIHSVDFDPSTQTSTDLVKLARKIAQKYWPVVLPESFDPLAEDVAMWMVSSDGSSRAAYMENYLRAHTIISKYGCKHLLKGGLANKLQTNFLKKDFSNNFVAHVAQRKSPKHPFVNTEWAQADPIHWLQYYSEPKKSI